MYHKDIYLKIGESSLGNQIQTLKGINDKNDKEFVRIIDELWNKWSNKDDRPAKRNNLGQHSLARVYDDGNVSLDKYLSMADLLGAIPRYKIGHSVEEGLIYPKIVDDDEISIEDVLGHLNSWVKTLKKYKNIVFKIYNPIKIIVID